jgi:hypothetical protein
MLYAGYYNIKTATLAPQSAPTSTSTSANPSRRASAEKGPQATASAYYEPTTTSRRSSLRKALDFLSPYETPLTAEAMYGSSRRSSSEAAAHQDKRARKEAKKAKARAERKTLIWNTERACYEQVTAA